MVWAASVVLRKQFTQPTYVVNPYLLIIRKMCSKITREWFPPSAEGQQPALVLYNSLIDEKVPFIPAAGVNSKQITWYTCGPTVYDSAHMGHARNYVTFDIVRRVLEDYFGYNCLYVMNVTDVDDKIIMRARRNYLLNQYKNSLDFQDCTAVRFYAEQSMQNALNKQQGKYDAIALLVSAAAADLGNTPPDKQAAAVKKKDELEAALSVEGVKLKKVNEALTALQALPADAGSEAVLAVVSDYVAEALDKQHGSSVTDPSIYRAHAAKYEREFLEDMEALGCRTPDVLTRVSEYIDEIISYCERIIANGMAYESKGSVYFDTANFRSCGHTYGKLKPWAVGSATLAAEGETNFETSEKRAPSDFALWKASKPGEPYWESPWGKGRPGWHIECSAMASAIVGAKLDIHTGGEDLRFPHHDNELAQAEAYYHTEGCRQWVNYFLHSGHLGIDGQKMSKSLKNFTTIREALLSASARQIRLMFALQPWWRPMVYGQQAITEMKAKEALLKNFFQNVDVAVRSVDPCASAAKWGVDESELRSQIESAQAAVHAALCDNINTQAAMDALCDLVKSVNVYLARKQEQAATAAKDGSSASPPQPFLLRKAAGYVTRILSCFGIVDAPTDKYGFGDGSSSSSDNSAKYLDVLSQFRDEVRLMAKAKAEPRELLAACDKLRDVALVDVGVRLEDRPDGKAVWKLDDPAVLRAEQCERAQQAAEAAAKKLSAKLDLKVKDKAKLDSIAALPPVQEVLSDKYSKFDPESGEPTHDKDGNELDGKARDKARKDFDKAMKVREPLKKLLQADPQGLEKLAAEIDNLKNQLAAMALAANGHNVQ